MYRIDREFVKQAFASSTDRYNSDDPKIKLKIYHTYRVADLCDRIAKTVSGADPDLAWLCGMLHDIGRFEQIRRYDTFSDSASVDHAVFGADLLFRDDLVDSFGTYDGNTRSILETAIRNHNRFTVEEGLSDICISYCNILRDADKIDIFRVSVETPIEDIYNIPYDEIKRSAVTEAVKNGFKERHAILRSVRKTPADLLVSHISLVHELVFPISIKIVQEQGYLNKMLDFRSENKDTEEWFEYMKNFIALNYSN